MILEYHRGNRGCFYNCWNWGWWASFSKITWDWYTKHFPNFRNGKSQEFIYFNTHSLSLRFLEWALQKWFLVLNCARPAPRVYDPKIWSSERVDYNARFYTYTYSMNRIFTYITFSTVCFVCMLLYQHYNKHMICLKFYLQCTLHWHGLGKVHFF